MDEQIKQDLLKAVTLSEALPYIRDFNGKTIIIQYDGQKVDSEIGLSLIEDIALLKIYNKKTGLAGFEPATAAVKVLCLTAWR